MKHQTRAELKSIGFWAEPARTPTSEGQGDVEIARPSTRAAHGVATELGRSQNAAAFWKPREEVLKD